MASTKLSMAIFAYVRHLSHSQSYITPSKKANPQVLWPSFSRPSPRNSWSSLSCAAPWSGPAWLGTAWWWPGNWKRLGWETRAGAGISPHRWRGDFTLWFHGHMATWQWKIPGLNGVFNRKITWAKVRDPARHVWWNQRVQLKTGWNMRIEGSSDGDSRGKMLHLLAKLYQIVLFLGLIPRTWNGRSTLSNALHRWLMRYTVYTIQWSNICQTSSIHPCWTLISCLTKFFTLTSFGALEQYGLL